MLEVTPFLRQRFLLDPSPLRPIKRQVKAEHLQLTENFVLKALFCDDELIEYCYTSLAPPLLSFRVDDALAAYRPNVLPTTIRYGCCNLHQKQVALRFIVVLLIVFRGARAPGAHYDCC